jgi:PAS domain S-box-containing protein
VSLGVVAAAILVRVPLAPLLGDRVPFITLFPAMAFVAWCCGRGPALAALGFSSLAVAFFILEPQYSFAIGPIEHQAGLVLYLLIGLGFIAMFESLRTAWLQAAEQRERLRTTLASIGDAVIATDTEGCITNLNAVAESLTGWTNGAAVGQPLDVVFRIVNEQTRQTVENPVQKVLKLGRVVGLANHTVLIAKDGTERPIDDSAAPIRCEDGEIVGCVLVFRDVSERREAEKAVQLLASIVDSSNDAIIGKDVNGVITSWNRAAERLFGYSAAEAVGQSVGMLVPPDRADEMPALLARIRQGEQVDHFDTVRRTKDGRLVPISLTVSPIKDEYGQIVGASKTARDISERKQAEAALREEKTRLHATLHGIGDGVIVTDAEGRVSMMNPVAQELTAWKDEAVGRPLEDVFRIVNEQTRKIVDSPVTRALREGVIVGLANHTILIRKDGTELPIDDSAAPIRDAHGHVFGCVLVFRDVTERKRSEEALKEADRRKNEFLATLAHELRNPLAPIRNAIQILLMKGPPDPEMKWGREVIDRQVQHMARLLDDLLDVSRITHNKLDLRIERIELSAVVQNAIETCQPFIQRGGQKLTVTLPQHPVYLDADPVRLSQVFSNLLNNAAKYSEPGCHIRLIGERQGSDVVVSVQDDGIGIAPQMLPRIFEIFSQAQRILERSQGGLGIGLSLVRGLVELHGGSVEAHSDGPGKGSTFTVRLPLVVQDSVPVQVAVPPARHEQTGARKCRLLIVDDLRDSADSLAMLLKAMGHEVHTAYDGENAVTLAEKLKPEAVLLDIGMPKLNGYDACRRIRQQPWGLGMSLIALTGWGQEDDRHRTEEAGFNHHMVKPVDPGELMQVLASLLQNKGTA